MFSVLSYSPQQNTLLFVWFHEEFHIYIKILFLLERPSYIGQIFYLLVHS